MNQTKLQGRLQGRFLTADPYEASGGASAPGSWNRYPYVGGDPVNFNDLRGLEASGPVGCDYFGSDAPGGVFKAVRDGALNDDRIRGLEKVKDFGGNRVFTDEAIQRLTNPTARGKGGMWFEDGTTSSQDVVIAERVTIDGVVVLQNRIMTSAEAFKTHPEINAIRSGDKILIRPGVENRPEFKGMIVHELLHLTGANDIGLRDGLVAASWVAPPPNGVYPRDGATSDLSIAIMKNCF